MLPRVAQVLGVLSNLLRKDADTSEYLSREHMQALEQIKCELAKHTLLQLFDYSKPFDVHVDSLPQHEIAAMLCQVNDKDQMMPILFLSRWSTGAKKIMWLLEMELQGTAWAVADKLCSMLYGSKIRIHLNTQSIKFLMERRDMLGDQLNKNITSDDHKLVAFDAEFVWHLQAKMQFVDYLGCVSKDGLDKEGLTLVLMSADSRKYVLDFEQVEAPVLLPLLEECKGPKLEPGACRVLVTGPGHGQVINIERKQLCNPLLQLFA